MFSNDPVVIHLIYGYLLSRSPSSFLEREVEGHPAGKKFLVQFLPVVIMDINLSQCDTNGVKI